MTSRNPFLMTNKNKMTIYSFIIRHNCPNLLYVTYLHDVLHVCTTSICFCSPKGTIMKIRSILTCIMLSLPQYLIVKLLDTYIVFCKVVFYTHLLYLFVVANKYFLADADLRCVLKLVLLVYRPFRLLKADKNS